MAPDVWGIEVQSVTKNSPADKAGVREGDYVLTAGGREISSSQDLLRVHRQHHLGDELPHDAVAGRGDCRGDAVFDGAGGVAQTRAPARGMKGETQWTGQIPGLTGR